MYNVQSKRALWRTFCVLGCSITLAACAPISLPRLPVELPQLSRIFPGTTTPPPQANAPVQRLPPPVQTIPKAGALPKAPAKVARPAAPVVRNRPVQAVAPARQVYRPAASVAVPPALNPAQVKRAPPTPPNYRPSASVRRAPAPVYQSRQQNRQPIWEDNVQVAPASRNPVTVQPVQRPSAAVRRSVPAQAKPVAKPAPVIVRSKPVEPKPVEPTSQPPVQTAKPEIIDLSADTNVTSAVTQQPKIYSSSPAVTILTKQANNQLAAGQADRAAATLERALRIESENPLLWLRLAEVNAQQGRNAQASSMATKALNLAPDDAGLQARARRLMR